MTWGSMKHGWSPVYIELGCPVWAHSANTAMRTNAPVLTTLATSHVAVQFFGFSFPAAI